MQGAERERLIEEYHQAVKKYSEAVSRLLDLEGRNSIARTRKLKRCGK